MRSPTRDRSWGCCRIRFLVEPHVGVGTYNAGLGRGLWPVFGLLLVSALEARCGRVRRSACCRNNYRFRDLRPRGKRRPVGWSLRLLWIGLAACASVLLLATTNLICQDIAVSPFLWVLQLSLYLLSFIVCFESDRWYRREIFYPRHSP